MANKTDIGLREASTEQIVKRLVLDMLQRFHTGGVNPTQDQRIEEAWKSLLGTSFFPRNVTPTYLRGYPGQGKSTCFRVAAERVAEHLGLAFVSNPTDDYQPTGQELLFIVQELSGQVSAVDFGGIPNVQQFQTPDGQEQAFMTKLANKRLAALPHAGAAVLLLDDFSNASPNIQNVALSILMENRFQGLTLANAFVGATGNLGTTDGTHVSATSNAIVTRVANFLVVDSAECWIERTHREYDDELGDCGVAGFLMRYPDLFHMPKRSRDGVPYPCPRSWSLFLPKLREIWFSFHEQRQTDPELALPFEEIEFETAGFLGLEVANKLASYFLSSIQLSDPLAKTLVEEGGWSEPVKETFQKQYSGGFAANSQQFGYQFVTALADHAAKNIIATAGDQQQWHRVAKALADGLYGIRLDHALISYGAHYFALRTTLLARALHDAASSSWKIEDIGLLDGKGRPNLSKDLIAILAEAISQQSIAQEILENKEHGQPLRLMDETFFHIVSHYSGYND